MFRKVLFLSLLFAAFACEQDTTSAEPPSALDVLARAREAHGYADKPRLNVAFRFREIDYSFRTDNEDFTYTRKIIRGDTVIVDTLDNLGTRRYQDGQIVAAPDTMLAKYGNALNSVIYFATLPDKLDDPAVNLIYDGKDTIKDKTYDLLRVSFAEEGGGKDHDDNFLYWVREDSGVIDYLAYDYRVDGGGVRFREAYNPRTVDGLLFFDHVNYIAPIGTPLNDLGRAFETGQLEELSRIVLEDVRSGEPGQ